MNRCLQFIQQSCLFAILLLGSAPTLADILVEKQRFEIASFDTFNGQKIKQLAVGWESYGTLNSDKSNVILITHYFTGNSHAAGKYAKDDPAPGYWDALIGPGKAIDTNQFFVISVDTLANLGVYDPHVITTGPASINPDTQKPYGLSFPVVTIRDFVNVQKAVLESLGIEKLHAVIGPSMGSMQAIDWAAAYPEWVPRMISVIGTAQSDAWTTALLEQWAMPIKLDANWNQGNYYQSEPPTAGLIGALMMITQDALSPAFFNQQGAGEMQFQPLEPGPLMDINQNHSIINWLSSRAAARAKNMDANHLLYLVRACQLFIAGHQSTLDQGLSKLKAKVLLLPSSHDMLLMPYQSYEAQSALNKLHKENELILLDGPLGHLEGVLGISQQAKRIREFLAQ